MAALPYMRLYIADYLADTAHLSAIQHGAYLLLIMNYWQTGRALPSNDVKLARIARMTPKEWAEHGPVLAEFFQDRDGAWHHKRIDAELDAVAVKSDKARTARQQRTHYGRLTNVGHSLDERATEPQRTPNHTDTDTDTERKKEQPRVALEREFDEQFWPEYPLKKSRGAAVRAYRTARNRVDLPTILAALRRQRPTWTDPKFTKHAATWLNGECWADDAPSTLPSQSAADIHAGRVKTYRETGFWKDDWGNRPEAAA